MPSTTVQTIPTLPSYIICFEGFDICITKYGCVNVWNTAGTLRDRTCITEFADNFKFCLNSLVELDGLIGDCCYNDWCNYDTTFPGSKFVKSNFVRLDFFKCVLFKPYS